MKRVKRIFAVVLLLLFILVTSYIVFTVKQLKVHEQPSINETQQVTQEIEQVTEVED